MQRILHAWGIDGHNSATPTSARPARAPATRSGMAPIGPSPDHANARFILLLSSHLEAGHYFNPHAQRIIEGKMRGAARSAVMDTRLSNTATQGRLLAARPGRAAEAAVLLAMCQVILRERTLRSRVRAAMGRTGKSSCGEEHPQTRRQTFDDFVAALKRDLRQNTRPEFAASASRARRPRSSSKSAREIGRAGSALRDRTSGATRRRAIWADGKWRARSNC